MSDTELRAEADRAQLRETNERFAAAQRRISRVLRLHIVINQAAGHCRACHKPYPCPTVRLLRGEDQR